MLENYSVILLAAGVSQRMGNKNKLLLPFRQTTLVEHCADQLLSLHSREIIVVTGFQATEVQFRLFDRPFCFSYNRNFRNGMTSSIQRGVSVCHPKSAGVLICQGDMPFITGSDLLKIEKAISNLIQTKKKRIVIPVVGKRKGNPVFFSRHYFDAILNHTEPSGCKSIIQQHLSEVIEVPLSNNNAFADIDTRADYVKYL